jgi:hypothetical protein
VIEMSDVETVDVVESTEELAVVVDTPAPVVKTRKARTADPNSRSSRARALFAEMSGQPRKVVVEAFVNEIGMAASTAATQYQKFHSGK